MVTKIKFSRLVGILAVALALTFLSATGASAATVSVTTGPGTPNSEVLTFVAGSEDNDVAIANVFGRPEQLLVVDTGAPLLAGPGCDGGGLPESQVICAWEPPRLPLDTPCKIATKYCREPAPGTGWKARFEIHRQQSRRGIH